RQGEELRRPPDLPDGPAEGLARTGLTQLQAAAARLPAPVDAGAGKRASIPDKSPKKVSGEAIANVMPAVGTGTSAAARPATMYSFAVRPGRCNYPASCSSHQGGIDDVSTEHSFTRTACRGYLFCRCPAVF